MKKFLHILLLASLLAPGSARLETLRYMVGSTEFIETKDELVVYLTGALPIHVDRLAGGKLWPPVFIDDSAKIYIRDKIIDSQSGRITAQHTRPNEVLLNASTSVSAAPGANAVLFTQGDKKCRLSLDALGIDEKKDPISLIKDSHLNFSAASDGAILALITHFDPDGTLARYAIERIDLDQCAVVFDIDLGNPDLLIELGWSREGKWWITGSVEQTLLSSSDGKNWKRITLPTDIYSLVSSYIVNDREIWLAAGLASTADTDDYMLVYSGDGGTTWTNINKENPALNRIPPDWLEGFRRRWVGRQ